MRAFLLFPSFQPVSAYKWPVVAGVSSYTALLFCTAIKSITLAVVLVAIQDQNKGLTCSVLCFHSLCCWSERYQISILHLSRDRELI